MIDVLGMTDMRRLLDMIGLPAFAIRIAIAEFYSLLIYSPACTVS